MRGWGPGGGELAEEPASEGSSPSSLPTHCLALELCEMHQRKRLRQAQARTGGKGGVLSCPQSPTRGLPRSLATADMRPVSSSETELSGTGQAAGIL